MMGDFDPVRFFVGSDSMGAMTTAWSESVREFKW
jgi:hypothetical protein